VGPQEIYLESAAQKSLLKDVNTQPVNSGDTGAITRACEEFFT
jgi:hypothetical protein